MIEKAKKVVKKAVNPNGITEEEQKLVDSRFIGKVFLPVSILACCGSREMKAVPLPESTEAPASPDGTRQITGFGQRPDERPRWFFSGPKVVPCSMTYGELFECEVKKLQKHRFYGDSSFQIIVCLNENQIKVGWCPLLKRLGFKHVWAFRNTNSNRICHTFIWSVIPKEDHTPAEFKEDNK
jgi:hypothetical protein